uniref:MOB kinase activator 3C n=1 Tax=Gopherus evgoodei TaxID=1825980 RepID=A0A8C4YN52_9SAUR
MALCLSQVFNKDKTFRPRKKFEPGTQRFELYKKAQASLKSGLDLKTVVQLPPGENINDWIAVHVVDFFNRINLIYGTMSEFCTEKSCPIMSGGLKYEYRWQDDHKYKRPTKLSAPQYMCMLMEWIEMLINNEDIFPTRIAFPVTVIPEPLCTGLFLGFFSGPVASYFPPAPPCPSQCRRSMCRPAETRWDSERVIDRPPGTSRMFSRSEPLSGASHTETRNWLWWFVDVLSG